MTPCPFQVGDRIREQETFPGYYDDADPEHSYQILRDHPTHPDATVTAITSDGFAFEYDTPVPMGRVQWGQMCTGGECYPEGYQFWRKLT